MHQSNSNIFLTQPKNYRTGQAAAFNATGTLLTTRPARAKSVYKLLLLSLAGCLFTLIISQQAFAQPPINLTYHQGLNFGEFYPGSTGGTVKVNFNGIRTATGTVVLTGGNFNAAYIGVNLNPNRNVLVTYSPTATLSRSGGGNLQLAIAPGDLSINPLISTPKNRDFNLYIGGTLTVGNLTSNPPGNYTGVFYVYFNYQ